MASLNTSAEDSGAGAAPSPPKGDGFRGILQSVASRKKSNEPLPDPFVIRRKELYDQVCSDLTTKQGKAISIQEREEKSLKCSTLTYGEIEFNAFADILLRIKQTYGKSESGTTPPRGIMQEPGGIFWDLGSGTGKPSIAAAFIHPFSFVGGVEILEGLHDASLQLAEKFNNEGRNLLAKDGQAEKTEIEFTLGSALDFNVKDWSNGDLCFANSTCFDNELMAAVAKKATFLKKGAIFITLTKRLPSQSFTVLDQSLYQMSWGGATAFIHQKLTDPGE
eukprot:CAMPEP_0172628622 /NCGR_PEP_ID=MMETSP1068-20121228/162913_1 /TAXON_ID=35684 /ORGANISM="Pseudopedinella elastica, Strain CCMP716" /LENGTH=277 /DNA_ID=CAMNT_0013438893 /DNA_START=24 /DNA_END=857 /DNA_ORIENTATION=-